MREICAVVDWRWWLVVGYVWSWRYQTGGRYLLIDLDTENEPSGAVTLTVLLIIIISTRTAVLPSH